MQESEDGELRRHPEVREDGDRLAVVVDESRLRPGAAEPVRDEPLDEPVLRRVEEHVQRGAAARPGARGLGHRRRLAAPLGAVQALGVEVDAQHAS